MKKSKPVKNRIAIGILAHAHSSLLDQLVQRLLPDFDIFIHIDSASPLSSRQFEWADKVHFLRRRRTYWGSFNCTRAVLDYLKTAAKSDYSHFLFISGQDVPLKSNKEIKEFLAKNDSLDFIESFPLPSPALNGGLERITRMYWHAPYRHTGLRRLWYNIVEYGLELGYRTVLQPKVIVGPYYWGEAGFALSSATVRGIFSYLELNPHYTKLFRGSRLGEELFLQTLVRRIDPPGNLASHTIAYADWKTGPEKPRVLDASDLTSLTKTPHLFARKVHPEKSKELLRELEQQRSTPSATKLPSS